MNCPNVRTISGKVLEQTILDELNSIVSQYCQADEISFTNHYEEQLRTLESTLAKLNEKHASSQKRLVQMYKDKLDGILSDADYALFRQNLADEEHALTQRIAEVRQQITETRERMENSAGQKALIEQYTHFDTLDRTVADEFIDRVEIGMTDDSGEREIHIHWKI